MRHDHTQPIDRTPQHDHHHRRRGRITGLRRTGYPQTRGARNAGKASSQKAAAQGIAMSR